MKTKLMAGAAFSAALFLAGASQATTYIGTRHVGAATAQLSITTDGTIGVLHGSNITDWTITLSDPGHTATLFGPLIGGNSKRQLVGDVLSATATQILFDFGGHGSVAFADSAALVPKYCLVAGGFTCGRGDFREDIYFSVLPADISSVTYDDLQVIATAVSGGVPEPATWALMIVGFGLTGLAMRRRTRAQSIVC